MNKSESSRLVAGGSKCSKYGSVSPKLTNQTHKVKLRLRLWSPRWFCFAFWTGWNHQQVLASHSAKFGPRCSKWKSAGFIRIHLWQPWGFYHEMGVKPTSGEVSQSGTQKKVFLKHLRYSFTGDWVMVSCRQVWSVTVVNSRRTRRSVREVTTLFLEHGPLSMQYRGKTTCFFSEVYSPYLFDFPVTFIS